MGTVKPLRRKPDIEQTAKSEWYCRPRDTFCADTGTHCWENTDKDTLEVASSVVFHSCQNTS